MMNTVKLLQTGVRLRNFTHFVFLKLIIYRLIRYFYYVYQVWKSSNQISVGSDKMLRKTCWSKDLNLQFHYY